jgi:hypothetical protein
VKSLHVQGDAGHPVDRVVDKKRIIGKTEGQGEGEAQGVADPPPKKKSIYIYFDHSLSYEPGSDFPKDRSPVSAVGISLLLCTG